MGYCMPGTYRCFDIEVRDENDDELIMTVRQIYIEVSPQIRDSATYIFEKTREIVSHLIGPIDFELGDWGCELLGESGEKRAAIYVRSDDEDADLMPQIQACIFKARELGFEVGPHIRGGASGLRHDSDSLSTLVSGALCGLFGAVVVTDRASLARNPVTLAGILRLLEDYDVKVVEVSE